MQSLPADSIQAVLADVLSGTAYATPDPPIFWRWLGSARAWIGELISPALGWLLDALALGTKGWGPTLAWGVLFAAITVLALLIFLAGRALVRLGLPGRRQNAVVEAGASVLTPEMLEAAAEQSAGAGRVREASLLLYRALLLRLSSQGRITLDEARTPGEYRRELLRGLSTASQPLAWAFFALFEVVAYGPDEPPSERFETLRLRARELLHG